MQVGFGCRPTVHAADEPALNTTGYLFLWLPLCLSLSLSLSLTLSLLFSLSLSHSLSIYLLVSTIYLPTYLSFL